MTKLGELVIWGLGIAVLIVCITPYLIEHRNKVIARIKAKFQKEGVSEESQ